VLAIGCGSAVATLVIDLASRPPWLGDAVYFAAATSLGVWATRNQGLWLDRINSVRAIEMARITRAVLLLGLGLLVLDRIATLNVRVTEVAIGCVIVWTTLVVWRSLYREWLERQRLLGRFVRELVIVGTDRRAIDLFNLFAVHPEVGMSVVGVIGSEQEAGDLGLGALWLAEHEDANGALARTSADGVVLCSTDIEPSTLNRLIRDERGRQRVLYLDPGLSGIDARHLQAWPVAHEPLLFVEPVALSKLEAWTKRGFDIVGASLVLALVAPLMAAIAVLVKLTDSGPALFHQCRIGRDGASFTMHKFRTMAVDAEARRAQVEVDNLRSGPLFKLDHDPRVTPIGRLLRRTSLDELPQLWNVMRGQMSLVGPRPALAAEVAEFPSDLVALRHQVRPGITGLWQVEARDNPSFEAYRRLDLFYVENWSLALDLILILRTIEQIVLRPLRRRLCA